MNHCWLILSFDFGKLVEMGLAEKFGAGRSTRYRLKCHALKTLAERNPHLKDIIDNVDFIQFTTSRENAEILRQLYEIKNNDYNLNVTLYVFPQEEAENIDVDKEWQELRMIEGEIVDVEINIEGYLKEIMQNERFQG